MIGSGGPIIIQDHVDPEDEDGGEIDSYLIRERKVFADDGLVSVIFTINYRRKLLRTTVITRGFIYSQSSDTLIQLIKLKAELLYNEYIETGEKTAITLQNIANDLSNYIHYKTERRPLVAPITIKC